MIIPLVCHHLDLQHVLPFLLGFSYILDVNVFVRKHFSQNPRPHPLPLTIVPKPQYTAVASAYIIY